MILVCLHAGHYCSGAVAATLSAKRSTMLLRGTLPSSCPCFWYLNFTEPALSSASHNPGVVSALLLGELCLCPGWAHIQVPAAVAICLQCDVTSVEYAKHWCSDIPLVRRFQKMLVTVTTNFTKAYRHQDYDRAHTFVAGL